MGIPTKYCYNCLCEVCTRRRCPFTHAHRFQDRWYFCQHYLQQNRGARLDCDFFEHKCKKHIYRLQPGKRKNRLEDKLDRILALLESGKPPK